MDVAGRDGSLARVREVVAGLKEGVPLLEPAPPARVEAIAAAATLAVARASPDTPTTEDERAALRALARGTMRGALAADEADAELLAAIIEGAARAIQDARPEAEDVEAYASSFAASAPRGSPGLARAIVAAQVAALPHALAAPDALAAAGATILGAAGDEPSALGRAALPAMARAMAWRAPQESADVSGAASLLARLGCAVDDAACASIGAALGEAAATAVERADAAGSAYGAVAREAAALAGSVPTDALGVYAGETTRWLLLTPPDERAERAAAAAARVVSLGAGAADLAQVEREVARVLTPAEDARVRIWATDGVRTLDGAALDGASRLDGLRDIIILAQGADERSAFDLRWSGGKETFVFPMEPADGVHRATIPADALSALPPAALVAFLVVELRDGETREHGREDAPFAFVPDRDAPVVRIEPAVARGPGFALAWSAEDVDGAIESHRIQVREEDAGWRDWLARTADTRASFHGEPGRSYAFRAFATDAMGHESEPSEVVELRVPPTAPANRAPDVSFREPADGSAFASDVPVALDASDPDGTAPAVRICVRKADAALDILCMHETPALLATLDASALPDGAYRLHAYATDGTRTSEATSGAFALDRTPPAIRGAMADATPTRVRFTASVEDAWRVRVEVGGRSLALTDDGRGVDARGGDDVWTTATLLPAGEHVASFLVEDALGNLGRLQETFVVPAALAAPPARAVEPAPLPSIEAQEPPVRSQAPEPREAPGLAAWAALGALALAARRR